MLIEALSGMRTVKLLRQLSNAQKQYRNKTVQKGIFMRSKKITVIISYDYEDKNTVSNDRIADRVKNDLLKGSNPNHEKIESVTVEDNQTEMKQKIEEAKGKINRYYSDFIEKCREVHGIDLTTIISDCVTAGYESRSDEIIELRRKLDGIEEMNSGGSHLTNNSIERR